MIEVAAVPKQFVSEPALLNICRLFYRLWGIQISNRILSVGFAGERESQRLNRVYRGENKPTNILSFIYRIEARLREGEVILCPVVIRREAVRFGVPLKTYVTRLLVHGLLHIEGYDHATHHEETRMVKAEMQTLKHLNVNSSRFW